MRRAIFVSVFLLLGALVNVAVAWGCSIWSTAWYSGGLLMTGDQSELDDANRDAGFKIRLDPGTWVWQDSAMLGVNWRQVGKVEESVKALRHFHMAGWPMRSLQCVGTVEQSGWQVGPRGRLVAAAEWSGGWNCPAWLLPDRSWTLMFPEVERPLPYTPRMLGFLFNTVVYGSALFVIIIGPRFVRNARRRRRGLCIDCGYPIGSSPVCTECGEQLPTTGESA